MLALFAIVKQEFEHCTIQLRVLLSWIFKPFSTPTATATATVLPFNDVKKLFGDQFVFLALQYSSTFEIPFKNRLKTV